MNSKKYKCLYCKLDNPKCEEKTCLNGKVTKKVQDHQKWFIKFCEGMAEYRKNTSLWS